MFAFRSNTRMDRIDRRTLEHLIVNALMFGDKRDRRELEQTEILAGEAALMRVAKRVCDQIDNDRRAVVQIAPNPGVPFTRFCG